MASRERGKIHQVELREHIIDRVLARRGRLHLYDALDAERTAFVIIDMINMFVEPGAPAEVAASRGIVAGINALTRALRPMGCRIVWITSPIMSDGQTSAWNKFFDNFVSAEMRALTLAASAPGSSGQELWPELEREPSDFIVEKNRYSALIAGASPLERLLRSIGVDTILIGGTKTNICCESTARDAMMLDFDVVMVSDCLAALSDEEHLAALENIIQQFGDVMNSAEVLAVLSQKQNRQAPTGGGAGT